MITLAQVLEDAIDAKLSNVNTALPAKVTRYDQTKALVDVKPLLKREFPDGPEEYPVISNVPLVFPRTSGACVRLPIAVDDTVLLVFAQCSLDAWLSKGGIVDPEDLRKFALQDAVAIPGLFPFTKSPSQLGASSSLVVTCGSAYLEVTSAGKFKLVGASGTELLSTLSTLIQKLEAAVIICGGLAGGFTPAAIADLEGVRTSIAGITG